MSIVPQQISFNQELDSEAKVFSHCFLKTINVHGNKVFSSKEVQEVSQCAFDLLEKMYRNKI